MNSLNRIAVRSILPLVIGLVLVILAFSLLTPVSASNHSVPIDLLQAINPLNPQGALNIPVGTIPVNLDGKCSEYSGDSLQQSFTDYNGFTGTVYLKLYSGNLYVCMNGASGQLPERFASVYLDTRDAGALFAGVNDYALRVDIISGTTRSAVGTGAGNYTPLSIAGWSAAAASGTNDVAEYEIPASLTGGACGKPFGLAVYHHWLTAVGDDYGWPSNTYYDRPASWTQVIFNGLTCSKGNIAYIYKRDTATAADFKNLLDAAGFTVDLIPLNVVTTTNFKDNYDLLIVAADTGLLNTWGTSASQVTHILTASKPIVGLGEGGYAFFGQTGSYIGWPQGWHSPQSQVRDADPTLSYYHAPYDFTGLVGNLITLYSVSVDEVGIFVSKPPTDVLTIGWEPPSAQSQHAPLIAQGCNQLWGYNEGPARMDESGSRLFVNAVVFGLNLWQNCAPPPPPPPPNGCLTLVKSAVPPTTTHVHPGDVISYMLTYTVTNNANCNVQKAGLIDQIPPDTQFVPGSASDGNSPNIEHTLIWDLGSLTPATVGHKTFEVYVLDTQCNDQHTVINHADLNTDIGSKTSNTLAHIVDCPPVTFPNTEPPYAEEDIQVYPYPLITGHATQLSARVRNLTANTQTVTVTFQTSPNRFGIGLNFSALPVPGNPRVVTLPPYGIVQVNLNWTPVSSGHYCIQVKVEGAGFVPLYTQRNLDVTENLQPGVEDQLVIAVGNPTTATANIDLVVDNSCPGWIAWIDPATLLGVLPNDTQILTATLHVVPPSGGPPLGTGCHIDVQGWINGRLIGGIRKLDVPPVNLPHSSVPWEEPEIVLNPDPPAAGQLTQYCVELQNPLPITRTVTIEYNVADFGAGIGFTPVATQTFDLPPNSLGQYCINWTPTAGGTLHRCLLVVLKQPGFVDQRSQRNVDLRPATVVPGFISVTFEVGNPFLFTRTLSITPTLIGLDSFDPHITPDPPPFLGPGEVGMFVLNIRQAALSTYAPSAYASQPPLIRYGDVSEVEVSIFLDGEPQSGFTVEYGPPLKVYLPLVLKNH